MPGSGHDPATCLACAYDRLPKDPPWQPPENCQHEETWFDRSICAEPCGGMHDVCTACSKTFGCYFDTAQYAAHVAANAS